MKNVSIDALIESVLERTENTDLLEWTVEFIEAVSNNYTYKVVVSYKDVNGWKNVLETLEVKVYNENLLNLESSYSIDSEDVRAMLQKQFAPHCNVGDLQSKIFRSAPCNFSYSLKEDNEINDYYLAVTINVVDSNYF